MMPSTLLKQDTTMKTDGFVNPALAGLPEDIEKLP